MATVSLTFSKCFPSGTKVGLDVSSSWWVESDSLRFSFAILVLRRDPALFASSFTGGFSLLSYMVSGGVP